MPKIDVVTRDLHVRWYSFDPREHGDFKVHVRGYAFFADQYYENRSLVRFVWEHLRTGKELDLARVSNLCEKLNGAWALIIEISEEKVIAATDRFRNIPLFYARFEDRAVISVSIDDILMKMKSIATDDDSALEFLLSRSVTCGNTLFEGVRQVLPGEIIEIQYIDNDFTITPTRYYRFLPRNYSKLSEEDLERQLSSLIHSVFQRFLKATRGKTILIPLSGGLDSRLVAAMLKKFGYEDVICYSYGREKNPEAIISREVAGYLGYRWLFLETTPEIWTKAMASEEMIDYWDYGSKGTCLPHLQEFPALEKFLEDDEIGDNCVVWSGIAMDFLGGSLLGKTAQIQPFYNGMNLVEAYILWRRYNLWPMNQTIKLYSQTQMLRDRLLKCIDPCNELDRYEPLIKYEMYEVEHRIAYFLNNSMRLYEFHGLAWHLPFWDYEFVDFFLSVPLQFRFMKRLYLNTLRKYILANGMSELKRIPIYDRKLQFKVWDENINESSALNMLEANEIGFLDKLRVNFRNVLKRFTLVEKLYGKLKKRPETPQQFHNNDWWFSCGKDPRKLDLIDVLRSNNCLKILPEPLKDLLAPWMHTKLSERKCYSVFAVLMLSRIYEKYDGRISKTIENQVFQAIEKSFEPIMKVIVASSKFAPEYAGSGFRAHNTYQRLAEKYGVEYKVLCSSVEFYSAAEYNWEGIFVKRICSNFWKLGTLNRFPFLSRPYRILKYYSEFLQALSWLRSESFDCAHIFGISPTTAATAHFARYYQKPLIIELCNDTHSGREPSPFVKWARGFFRSDMSKGSIIVAISQNLKDLCGQFGYVKNVWCRPNPVDISRFYFITNKDKEKARLNIPLLNANNKVGIYIAKFWPQKNHIFLLDVLAELPKRYRFILAGPLIDGGPNAGRDKEIFSNIKRRILELKLEDRVLLLPHFVEAERYLSIADVYLFPAWNEALGTPLLESLACGVPVVANASEPAFRQWVEQGRNGFLCELVPQKWSEAIQECERMPSQHREDISKDILKLASSNNIDRNYMNILRYLIAKNPRGVVDIQAVLSSDGGIVQSV